jgi:hypothetical protein
VASAVVDIVGQVIIEFFGEFVAEAVALCRGRRGRRRPSRKSRGQTLVLRAQPMDRGLGLGIVVIAALTLGIVVAALLTSPGWIAVAGITMCTGIIGLCVAVVLRMMGTARRHSVEVSSYGLVERSHGKMVCRLPWSRVRYVQHRRLEHALAFTDGRNRSVGIGLSWEGVVELRRRVKRRLPEPLYREVMKLLPRA